jgi:hypothetical protein
MSTKAEIRGIFHNKKTLIQGTQVIAYDPDSVMYKIF